MKNISLGYSPCPNDTFIFYALTHNKINTGELHFDEVLLDVDLRSGGALGRGCGPLVVSKHDYEMKDLRDKKVAIPGRFTTAYLLLQLFDDSFKSSKVIPMPFENIMKAVAKEEVDAGLIIHESRFTYPSFGLKQVIDLGDWWEKETGAPIPLGGIVAKHSLGEDYIQTIDAILKSSVEYAFNNRDKPMSYIKAHSQELSEDVISRHIDLYVNDYTLDLGDTGQRAVTELLARSERAGIF